MEIKSVDFKKVTRVKTKDGLLMYKLGDEVQIGTKCLKEMCKYYDIPGTLVDIDTSLGVNFVQQAMCTDSMRQNPQFVVVDGVAVNPLDPKSKFVPDERFEEFTHTLEQMGYHVEPVKASDGIIRKKVELNDTEEALKFNHDIFSKQVIIDRLPEGGVSISGQVTRLACTNGSRVKEKELNVLSRSGIPSDSKVTSVIASVFTFNISEYFRKLWYNKGNLIPCSVGDYLGMRHDLESLIGVEADNYFPLQPLIDHYEPQNIDIQSIDRQTLKTIPAGVSYYAAYNFLTNGIKKVKNARLQDEIAVARWASPSVIRKLKAVHSVQYQGEPQFSEDLVAHLQGDK